YEMEGLEVIEKLRVETPFGEPSDEYVIGRLEDKTVAFLPRHGRGHRLLPSELNYRANLYGMKVLGVEWIVSVSAVGSLREEYAPTHIVIPTQFYDRTRHRVETFFGNGLVAHVSFAQPVCADLAQWMSKGAREAGATVHDGGTYVCMEGPMFSTRAESEAYRSRGFDIIGMTNLQEAKLAREAEMSYATMAMVTDYDCWHEDEADVSGIAVMEVIQQNVRTAQDAVRNTIRLIDEQKKSPFAGILRESLITEPDRIPKETRDALQPIVGTYLR
ncbi:MAG: S-methyl-5'-thioadenosine phosphorylase, partial [Acidobacteriota bacterium]|nr:S-methyl-5'-thioadenosine phosphorylase [Acidobacteriota bacterium]